VTSSRRVPPGPARRAVVALCGAIGLGLIGTRAAPLARAQPARVPRVAWLSMERENPASPFLGALRRGLAALGRVEGRDLVLETWWADGSVQRLAQLIPRLLASRPDVIVVASGNAVRPVIEAQPSMPLVFVFSADPARAGIVKSWARPGVNRTGVTYYSVELIPKRLELMTQLLPRMKRVAVVGWPEHAGDAQESDAARAAARRLGLEEQYFGVGASDALDAALEAVARWRADAVLVFAGPLAARAGRFADFAGRRRIPAVSAWSSFADAGNLMTYGPVLDESHARLASFVDRILKGEPAAEMPVEGPTRLELVINLKTARALGIAVPNIVLLQATRVIG
jgi:putative ABC transport system substrate-binding protein